MTSPMMGKCDVCGRVLEPFQKRCTDPCKPGGPNSLTPMEAGIISTLTPLEDTDDEEDDYKGGEGWVVVAVGERGRGCYLAVDPGFGALRYFINEGGLDDPSDADLMPDGDMGVFKVRARAAAHRPTTFDDCDNDITFHTTEAWVEVQWPSMEPVPAPVPEPAPPPAAESHSCKGCGHKMEKPGWCFTCRNPE